MQLNLLSENGLIHRELLKQQAQINELVERLEKYKIISTLPYPKIKFWNKAVTTAPLIENKITDFTSRYGFYDPSMIFKMLRRVRKYDLALVAGGERTDLVYLALAGLLPWIKTPHIIVDAHWQPADSDVGRWLQKFLLRLGRRLTVQVQPHSEEEIEIYARNFDLAPEKMRHVPWGTALIGYDDIQPRPGDFILTGGISFRDYDTFMAAVAQLHYPVEIGIPPHYQLPHIENCSDNVVIHHTLSDRQYLEKIAGCKFFAMPITAGLERSTADRTILNAMYYGKVVIATDSIGPRQYIEHGINGFLVPENDPQAWVETMRYAASLSDEEYELIGQRAHYDARVTYNEEMRLYRTLGRCREFLVAHEEQEEPVIHPCME